MVYRITRNAICNGTVVLRGPEVKGKRKMNAYNIMFAYNNYSKIHLKVLTE